MPSKRLLLGMQKHIKSPSLIHIKEVVLIPRNESHRHFELGITDKINAFMMAFEEHGTLLYYLKPLLNNHRTLFVKCPPAPSFVTLGKSFSDKTDSFSAAGQW